MDRRDVRVRRIGYGLAGAFAITGLLFLVAPGSVLAALGEAGGALGLPGTPPAAHGFFLALAVAYMYLVTVLAVLMARHPGERPYATLLVHAKGASALLSIVLFAAHAQQFAYLANFAVDGVIAIGVFWLCARPAASAESRRVVSAT
jgi:hypothetical protein